MPGLVRGAGVWMAAFAGGLAVGLVAWSGQMERCRRDLFSPSPVKRLAALGWLGGRPSVESARLLHDYLQWERTPALRRRGELLLRRIELDLE